MRSVFSRQRNEKKVLQEQEQGTASADDGSGQLILCLGERVMQDQSSVPAVQRSREQTQCGHLQWAVYSWRSLGFLCTLDGTNRWLQGGWRTGRTRTKIICREVIVVI